MYTYVVKEVVSFREGLVSVACKINECVLKHLSCMS